MTQSAVSQFSCDSNANYVGDAQRKLIFMSNPLKRLVGKSYAAKLFSVRSLLGHGSLLPQLCVSDEGMVVCDCVGVCESVGGWHPSPPLLEDAFKKGSIIYHRKRRKLNDSSKETITADQEREGTGTKHCLNHSMLTNPSLDSRMY